MKMDLAYLFALWIFKTINPNVEINVSMKTTGMIMIEDWEHRSIIQKLGASSRSCFITKGAVVQAEEKS